MKKKHKPNKQFRYQDHCIFCGRIPLTHEEIYAEWIREFLKSSDKKTKHTSSITSIDGKVDEKIKHFSGSIYVQTLKIVCPKCNNGWMSNIQNKTKKILMPMIQGHQVDLTEEDYIQLASWVTMFVMVYEYTDKKTVSVTQQERNEFSANSQPLKNWHIFCSSYQSKDRHTATHHRGFKVGITPEGEIEYNTQITVFTLGALIFACFSSSNSSLQPTFPIRATGVLSDLGFHRIWPLGSYTAVAPPQVLDETILFSLVDRIQERWITEPDNHLYVITNTY